MDLNPSQKKIVDFLRGAREDDEGSPDADVRARGGVRDLHEITDATGLGENTVRRNADALYWALYLFRTKIRRLFHYRYRGRG